MHPIVLGITGHHNTGKTTVAQLLQTHADVRAMAFSDGIYAEVAQAFGCSILELSDRLGKAQPQRLLALQHCTDKAFVQRMQEPVYSQPTAIEGEPPPMLQLHIPLYDQGLFAGVVLGEFSIDSLLRYGVPPEVSARYAVALLDAKGGVLAGNTVNPRGDGTRLLPWVEHTNEYEVPVSPIGR